jgi:hypothetical protein
MLPALLSADQGLQEAYDHIRRYYDPDFRHRLIYIWHDCFTILPSSQSRGIYMSKRHSETDKKKQKMGIEAFGPNLGSGQKSGHPRENGP